MGAFLGYLVDGLTLGGIYAVLAMGYALIYRRHRVIHFGHGDVAVLAAFLALFLLALVGPSRPGPGLGPLLFLGGVAASSLFAAVLGWLAYRLIYRPLSAQPLVYALTAAIGLALLLENVALALWGPGGRSFPDLLQLGRFTLFGAELPASKILALALSLALALGAHSLLTARPGASFLLVGVPAGAAAFIGGLYYGVVWYYLGLILGLNALVAAVAGGFSNLTALVVAGLGLGLMQGLAAGYLSVWISPAVGSQAQLILPFLVLLAVLFLRVGELGKPLGSDEDRPVPRGLA